MSCMFVSRELLLPHGYAETGLHVDTIQPKPKRDDPAAELLRYLLYVHTTICLHKEEHTTSSCGTGLSEDNVMLECLCDRSSACSLALAASSRF